MAKPDLPTPADIPNYLAEVRTTVIARLRSLDLPTEPSSLYEPLRYALDAPGKCLRPALTFLVGEVLGAERTQLLDPALAIEVLHTFTLVHDDIMDQASQRRGRPTIHCRWDTNTALLVGDALFSLAFEILLRQPSALQARLAQALAHTLRLICAGQALDVEFEKRDIVTPQEYLQMIGWKTGELLGLAGQFGALVAAAEPEVIASFHTFGIKLGQAFQVQDDLLELVADIDQMGKSLSSDISSGKKTYPVILVLEQIPPAQRRQWLHNLQAISDDREAVRQAFAAFNALQATADLARQLFAEAAQQLDFLPPAQRRPFLKLIDMIQSRRS